MELNDIVAELDLLAYALHVDNIEVDCTWLPSCQRSGLIRISSSKSW